MYRRQQSGGISTFLVVILLGCAAGVGYLIYNNQQTALQQTPIVTPAPESDPVQEKLPPTAPEAAAPQAVAAAREITQGASFYAPTAGIAGSIVQTYLDGTSWDVSDLGTNVGHLEGTGWLGSPGNIVLAGHVEMADGRKGIFARLDNLQIGDAILLSQDGSEHVYQVKQKFTTSPSDLSVVYPTDRERLTLITCTDYDFLQDTYHERFVVIAERI